MRLAGTLVATAAVTALVAAPVASATAASHKPAPKPRFVVSALIIGSKASYDVTSAPATVRVRVQVKDFDKKFNPASVKLVVVDKAATMPAETFTVVAHRVGRSKVVTNWLGTITVPKGSAPATYCLRVVKVDDASLATATVVATAKGLAGRDCFVVTSTPPAAPTA